MSQMIAAEQEEHGIRLHDNLVDAFGKMSESLGVPAIELLPTSVQDG